MRNRLLAAICVGAALSLALATASQTYVSMLSHGHSFARLLAWQLGCWIPWAVVAPWLVRAAMRFRGARLAAIAVAITIVQGVLAALSATIFQPFAPLVSLGFTASLGGASWFIALVNPLTCALLIVAGRALASYERARSVEAREAHLQAELTRAQLDALRLEIQPHFLFNTLNAIAALIRVNDNAGALKMLLGLSDLMRATLDQPIAQTAPLAGEMHLLTQYIDLQRARFGDRLEVRSEIGSGCETLEVPVLLLQPIVENALRHGLSQRTRQGLLTISAESAGGVLHLSVADNGTGLPSGFDLAADAGTGLRNTRARLERLHPGAASLRVAAAPGGGTRVDITLPAVRSADRRAPRERRRMTRFTALVAEDEPLARAMLVRLLRQDDEIGEIVECADAPDAQAALRRTPVDIAVLDIEMPGRSGLDIAAASERAIVVFVTAFSRYAPQAFEANAVDYVLKPFSDERFAAALSRAKTRVRERRLSELAGEMATAAAERKALAAEPARDSGYLTRLPCPKGDRSVLVRTADIVWIQAEDYYVMVHTRQERYILRASLASLEQRLDPRQFARVHRTAIVNVQEVAEVREEDRLVVVLTTGARVPVSRSRRREVEPILLPRLRIDRTPRS